MHLGHNPNKPSLPPESLRILVIEDDLVFNTFYKSFLGTKSAKVLSCMSLSEATQVLDQPGMAFDAVILDNQLTDGEGISLLPFLRQGERDPAVIMVSGNDDPEFFLTSFAAGIDDYMVKPVNLELLWVKINKAVNQHRLSQLSAQ
jgi:DNA-binding response OmpR family regulator